jgi:hypothetical protein
VYIAIAVPGAHTQTAPVAQTARQLVFTYVTLIDCHGRAGPTRYERRDFRRTNRRFGQSGKVRVPPRRMLWMARESTSRQACGICTSISSGMQGTRRTNIFSATLAVSLPPAASFMVEN